METAAEHANARPRPSHRATIGAGVPVPAMSSPETPDDQQLTRLLHAWRCGDADSRDAAVALVYARIRTLAAAQLRRHGSALQPTELAHELFLKMADTPPLWQDRAHFFRATALAMRNILLDLARQRAAAKHGGEDVRITLRALDEVAAPAGEDPRDLYDALEELRTQDARKADVIELVYLVGLENQEAADALGLSLATVNRDLRFARAWLKQRLQA